MVDVERVMHSYKEAYSKLYNRHPSDLRALENGWVVVNGARMSLNELEYLTKQLQLEYQQVVGKRRSVVSRLVAWFKGD